MRALSLKVKLFIIGGVISAAFLFFLVMAAAYITVSLISSAGSILGLDSNGNYTNTWGQYRETAYRYAAEYGLEEYAEIFVAQIRLESENGNTDVMNSSLKAYNTDYPQAYGGITDPYYSIKAGIQEMAYLLGYAGCMGIGDETRLSLALMGYHLGRPYVDYAVANGGHSPAIAAEYESLYGVSGNVDYAAVVIAYSKATDSGGYIFPFPDGYINSPFGYRTDPFTGKTSCHSGIDIPKPEGTPIMACNSGVVTEVSYTSVRGYYIVISHGDGIKTLYQHLQNGSTAVSVGQSVNKGEVIARVGSTGRSTGPHLHLCLYINGVLSDPEQYITAP